MSATKLWTMVWGLAVAGMLFAMGVASPSVAHATIVGFAGGTAHLSSGANVTVNLGDLYQNVDYYTEGGIKVDFIGGDGIVGNYYDTGSRPDNSHVMNNVMHCHWPTGVTSVVFTKLDNSPMDVYYVDETSNTEVGGSHATGNERSYITSVKGSLLLPSSDWGFDYTFYGDIGDGVKQLNLDDNFKGITSFTITSENAYCFGMDNFAIDEPIPEPLTMVALSMGIAGLGGYIRRRRMAAK